jgi:rubrerythrin
MPGFSTPFTVLASNAQLTHAELIRAIRFLIASEYEAVQLYTQLAESTDHKVAIQVLHDIADEERVHAGEFLRLLHVLSPDEAGLYARGALEVDEIIRHTSDPVKKESAYIRTSVDDPSLHGR